MVKRVHLKEVLKRCSISALPAWLSSDEAGGAADVCASCVEGHRTAYACCVLVSLAYVRACEV